MKVKRKLNKFIVTVIILTVIALFLPGPKIEAASFTISKSSIALDIGKTSTITISAPTNTGRINIVSSNSGIAGVNTGSVWVENNSQTITISAKSAGSATVTISGEVYDSQTEEEVTYTKTIKVIVNKPKEENSNGTQQGGSNSSGNVQGGNTTGGSSNSGSTSSGSNSSGNSNGSTGGSSNTQGGNNSNTSNSAAASKPSSGSSSKPSTSTTAKPAGNTQVAAKPTETTINTNTENQEETKEQVENIETIQENIEETQQENTQIEEEKQVQTELKDNHLENSDSKMLNKKEIIILIIGIATIVTIAGIIIIKKVFKK